MGARWSAGTSSSWISSRAPLRRTALPPDARTLRTHCTSSPSIDTRYRRPSTTAMTTGSERVRPDVRPATSNVTRKLGATPVEATAADALLRILAIQFCRRPRYNHRLKPLRVMGAGKLDRLVCLDVGERDRAWPTDRVLDLGDRVRVPHELDDPFTRSLGRDPSTVREPLRRSPFCSEHRLDFNLDAIKLDTVLLRLTIQVVAVARGQRETQQLAPIGAGADAIGLRRNR